MCVEQPARLIERVPEEPKEFVLPPVSLLNDPPFEAVQVSREELNLTSQRIEHILQNYKINAKVLFCSAGADYYPVQTAAGSGRPLS